MSPPLDQDKQWTRDREIEFRALLEVRRQPLTSALQSLRDLLRWSDTELAEWYISRRVDFTQLLECQTFKWLASSILEPNMVPDASFLPWMPYLDSALRLEFPMDSHWIGDDADGQSSLPIPTDLFIDDKDMHLPHLLSSDSIQDLALFEANVCVQETEAFFEEDVCAQQDNEAFFDRIFLEETSEDVEFFDSPKIEDISWF
jgi:hypothetical protein